MRLLSVILFAIGAFPSLADTPKRTVQHTIDDGLSQSTVSSIYQAFDGRIWFATGDGVSIFDGENYSYIYRSSETESGLQSNYISVIKAGPLGNIWVGTQGGGVSVFNQNAQFLFGFRAENANAELNDVYDIAWDSSDEAWFATLGGVVKPEVEDQTGINVLPPPQVDIYARQVLPLADGRILIGTGRDGLYIFANDPEVLNKSNSALQGDRVLDLFKDSRGGIWVATEDGGINHYEPDSGTISQPLTLPDTDIEAVAESDDGRIWFGSWSNGVYSFDPTTQLIENYRRGTRFDKGLTSNAVVALTPGATGSMWIGTYDAGATRMSQRPDPFLTFYADSSGITGPVSSVIWSIAEGRNNDVWVGSKGGLSKLSRSNNRFDVVDLGEGTSDVRAILPIDDHLLLAIRGRGLVRFKWSDKSVQTITNAQGAPVLGDAFVRLLMQDRDGQIWAGTQSGVFVLDQTLNVIGSYDTSNGLPHARVRSLYQSPDGVIWIGTSGGLTRIDPMNPVLRSFAGPDYFPDNDVRAVWQDQIGNLYVGTQAGITIINPDMHPTRQLLRKDGLPNETLYGLLPDSQGGLWAPTNNGLARLDLNTLTFDVYRARDGIQGAEFNFNAHTTLADGTIAVGGINGLSLFDPLNLTTNELPPILTISGPDNIDQLQAPAHVEIGATVTHFLDPSENQLRWKLDPSEATWQTARGPAHTLVLDALSAGKHTILLQGVSAAGVVSDVSMTSFDVQPHPLTRWWAIVAYVLIIGAGAWLFSVFRSRRITKHANDLERQIADQTAALTDANTALEAAFDNRTRFYTRAAHEIRTPISLIQAPLQSIAANTDLPEESRALLDLVQRAVQRLLHLSDEMFEGRNLGTSQIDATVTVNFSDYVLPILSLYRDSAQNKDIALKSHVPTIGDVILNVEAFELILHNLVSNAVKYTRTRGTIHLSFTFSQDQLNLVITNAGHLPKDAITALQNDARDPNLIARRGVEIIASTIAAVGGTIDVQNDPVRISTWLPAEPIQQGRPKSGDLLNPSLGRVLIIEDDADLLQYLTQMLSEFCVVEAVASCAAAKRVLAKSPPDLVLCDIVLPDGNGLTLMQTLKKNPETAHISVVFLTGQSGETALRKSRDVDADDYILKPFDIEDLLESIKVRLRNRNAIHNAVARTKGDDGEVTTPPSVNEYTLGDTIDDHIKRNLGTFEYTVDMLAAHCGISKRSLQRKLDATHGQNFTVLLSSRRMEEALQLLETGMSVKEVAYACGYRNVSSFTRKFTLHTGTRPAAYRRQFTGYN